MIEAGKVNAVMRMGPAESDAGGASEAQPWIGSRYSERRILVLAESSWGVDLDDADYVRHWLDHPNFLKRPECPLCVRCGKARPGVDEGDHSRDTLNDAITTMMLNWSETTDASRREAWSRIAFANFILRPVRDGSAKARPTEADWRAAVAAFPARLAQLAPRAVLVLDSPSRAVLTATAPLIEAAGVKLVRLPHLTMRPAPTRETRAAAWAAVSE